MILGKLVIFLICFFVCEGGVWGFVLFSIVGRSSKTLKFLIRCRELLGR